jgi:hypothetical protein
MGRRGIHVGYWWENRKEIDYKEDEDVGGLKFFNKGLTP